MLNLWLFEAHGTSYIHKAGQIYYSLEPTNWTLHSGMQTKVALHRWAYAHAPPGVL